MPKVETAGCFDPLWLGWARWESARQGKALPGPRVDLILAVRISVGESQAMHSLKNAWWWEKMMLDVEMRDLGTMPGNGTQAAKIEEYQAAWMKLRRSF